MSRLTWKSIVTWFDSNIFSLGREMRLSYLPPLMVYAAAGISGLTAIVGTFFVKDYLGLSASTLAAVGFWAGIPWALKMPIGHVVDLIWRYKSLLVYLGATLIAGSLLIMVGLLQHREAMTEIMSAEAWYVTSALLAPTGYVIQDGVADAMTVEAVPRNDAEGRPLEPSAIKLMHTTVQTLGRVAIIGGSVLVALMNLAVFSGSEGLPAERLVAVYRKLYLLALVVPLVSVAGVIFARFIRARERRRLQSQGHAPEQIGAMLDGEVESTSPNWWILIGSLVFVVFASAVGLAQVPFSQEIVFLGSLGILLVLVIRLMREIEPAARATLVGTALVILAFRSTPGSGPGTSWWMIDELGFDQGFFSVLSLIGSSLTLAVLFIFRRFMAERSITYVVGLLTVCGFLLGAPIVGMFYGLHEWTAAHTGGLMDARFIALVDTAFESPLGQIAMVPMLAWIANSAPKNLKATYFAVMASFMNLALSLSQLGTKYLNQLFLVTREVKDPVSGAILEQANYTELGPLLLVQMGLGLGLPVCAILLVRLTRTRTL